MKLAKEAVNESFELPLRAGVNLEKRLFHATFATVRNTTKKIGRLERRNEGVSGEEKPGI